MKKTIKIAMAAFMIIMLVMFVMLLFNSSFAKAVTQQELSDAKSLIDSKADCKYLSDSQLEVIGEYYMEQMHPGESHELMQQIMGLKDGSQEEEQFHINFARKIYCGQNGRLGTNMIGMMGGNIWNGNGHGMMGNYGYAHFGFWNVIWILFWSGIIVLIFWLICKFIIKQGKNNHSPIEILSKRYSKGEITKKQFKEMKKAIGE